LKVFFDEDVPRKLARFLPPHHEIANFVSMAWGCVKNGALLKLIEQESFQVFLTGDKNMPSQPQLKGRPFAVLVMSAINWPVVEPHVDKIVTAIDAAEIGATIYLTSSRETLSGAQRRKGAD
jgi:hypothetical protein